MAVEFVGRTGEQLGKKWSNLKTVFKSHNDEIFRYPSGGIEPSQYFLKWPNHKQKLWEYEWMQYLLEKIPSVTPLTNFNSMTPV